MIEVEVKARAPPSLEEKILALGALPAGVENHVDVYFSGARDFARTDEALRIRVKEAGVYLTYKGPKLDSKTKSRREVTVAVEDPVALEEILVALGYTRAAEVRKRRAKYRHKEITFALDEVEGLGSFVEIEVMAGEDWAERKDEILRLLEGLGVFESITESYLELLARQDQHQDQHQDQ